MDEDKKRMLEKQERKASVERAVINAETKKLKKSQGPKRKNKKPERDVEKEVTAWLKKNDFSFNVMEAKSTFSAKAGRYVSQSVTPGVSDIVGVDPNGTGCFIELKAPGKLKSLRPNQYLFLEEKISKNCFAVVVDSATLLELLYHEWLNAETDVDRKDILRLRLDALKPSTLIDDENPLF